MEWERVSNDEIDTEAGLIEKAWGLSTADDHHSSSFSSTTPPSPPMFSAFRCFGGVWLGVTLPDKR